MMLSGGALARSPREIIDVTIAEARASMLVDPRAAREKAQLAERQSGRIADPFTQASLRATSLWLQGEAAYRLKDFAAAEPKLIGALQLVQRYSPDSKLEGDVLVSLGSIQGDTGNVVSALRQFQQAHSIFVKLKDARNRSIALICIASLYSDAQDYQAALKYFDQALAAYDGDPGLIVSIQNNRAAVLRNTERYIEAEQGFRAALAIARTMRSPVLETQILRNIARSQLKRNDLTGADQTIADAQVAAQRADNYNQQAIRAVAAQAAFQHGHTRAAKLLIEDSFAGLALGKTSFSFRDAHATAYQVFNAIGEHDKAFAHLLALKRLDDQTTKLATSSGAALMAARFDFANQELRIARLKADDLERRIESAREQASLQRYIFFGGAFATAIVIAALLTGLIVVRRSRNRVRAANADFALANEALGKALAAKTEFLATTSHEIRTPLNGILGMTQVMLADPELAPVMRDRLAVVQGAGTTMRALVDDILDVAKMENGKLVLESAPFDLQATITDATRLWEAQAAAKGIAFVRALDSCPATVAGDAARVRQVVFNLLSNALKFTEAGTIAVSAERSADGQVRIAVRDSGIGIPADKLDAIFESFRQADAGMTRRFGGTGLGLAICRQLAQAMGGDVAVDSVLGEGSVFTVTLPLDPADAIDAQPVAEPGAPALLVVERNPIARSLFRTLLEPLAGRILFAGDPAEAAAIIRGDCVSRILVDDATARAGGDHAAALRAITSAAGGRAPVTLLVSTCGAAEREALLATGVDCIIHKPVTGPSLVATLFRQGNDPLVRRAA
jgi:signal transduction histidine kinase/CheY-like chemotaxis protein